MLNVYSVLVCTLIISVHQDQIKELPGHLVSEVNLGCQDSDTEHKYKVYVTTFLGHGANSARERYEEMLVKNGALLGRR